MSLKQIIVVLALVGVLYYLGVVAWVSSKVPG
jgi:nucleoside permease NupC